MRLAHINLRSIHTGFNEFKTLVVDSNNFDVIMVTETWLTDTQDPDVFSIAGYKFYNINRIGRGGGVGAYVRDSLHSEIISFVFDVVNNLELIFLSIKLKSITMAIGNFYRPPKTNLNLVINEFDNILSDITTKFDFVICLGDFNVDFLDLNNPVLNCFESYNLEQIINEPTRITQNTSRLIDPIFVSDSNLVLSSGTQSADTFSDHRLVFAELNLKYKKMEPKWVTYRCFKDFVLKDFLRDLKLLPWMEVVYENNIDSKVQLFNDLINMAFNTHAPIKSSRVTKPRAPWLTQGLKLIMRERDKALQKFKRTKTGTDWERYKELRNYTVSMVRAEKKAYLNFVLRQNNPRQTWKTLSQLNVRSSHDSHLPLDLSDPNKINNHFAQFIQNISNKCTNKINYYESTQYDCSKTFSFSMCTVDDINSALNKIKTNARGADGITVEMLKLCSPFIDLFITNIINCCIEQNYFPESWKIGIGKPLPKTRQPETFNDLRIISILPTMSKIMEKNLYAQIYSYLHSNNMLPDTQNGFREKHSTTSALTTVINDIIEARDCGLESTLVLLDYSKAFDTVDHRLLLGKLKYYGFDTNSLSLIKSYLSDRSQRVQVGDDFSKPCQVLSGVPQGSILGPLFFIIYTSDLLKATKYCKIQAYADDTQLYCHFHINNYQQSAQSINQDLEVIKSLSEDHALNLNPLKSKLLFFGKKTSLEILKADFNIRISDQTLQFCDSARNLGVLLDSKLGFIDHVKSLVQKSYISLKQIYSNRHILSCKLKKTLCESLVLSNFNYADFLYGPCLRQSEQYRIQKIQNTCCRLVFGLRKYDRISHKINELHWLNMKNRRTHHLGNFVHDVLSDNVNVSINLKIKFKSNNDIHFLDTRNKHKFSVPKHRTALFKKSFIYNAIKLYNSLPEQFRAYKRSKFKASLKTHLLDKQTNSRGPFR